MSKQIQDFKVFPLYFSSTSTAHHEIFVKEHHSVKQEDDKPNGKTLFALNLPPYATEDGLKNVFSVAGKVKSVMLKKNNLEDKECGFQTAFVVFQKRESLLKLMKSTNLLPISTKKAPVLVGLSKWVKEYNTSICNHTKLEKTVKEFMLKFDEKEKNEKLNEKNQVNEDGWTVVTKKGRTPGISRKESVNNKLIMKNTLKSRKKELKFFYRFQLKEEKKKNIENLRKRFEESKEKISLMKNLRVFKPF